MDINEYSFVKYLLSSILQINENNFKIWGIGGYTNLWKKENLNQIDINTGDNIKSIILFDADTLFR